MWRGPAWVTIMRDLVCLGLGVWGVVHEELSGKPNLGVLALYGVLMVAPGALATLWLAQSGTGSASPPSPPEPSPPPLPSNSPNG